MLYMRIPRNKFWGWVVVAMLFGLAVGLLIMVVRTSALSGEMTVLKNKLATTSATASDTTSAQALLSSAEASVTTLSDENAQLTSDLASATSKIAKLKSSSSSSSSSTATISVTSRSVKPSTVATSGTIRMTVKVTGKPTSVTMRVYNSSKSFNKVYYLHRISTSGKTQTWRATVKAPKTKGTYRYYATAIKGSVRKTMSGASPSSFTVK
jgi:hypothetical protein